MLYGDIKAIKLSSMREILQKILYYSCFTLLMNTYVKMYNSGRQYAWVKRFIHQRLNGEHLSSKAYFEQWLVGVTDGDGNFSINYSNGKWGLSYKIAQSRYNLRLLYYIKKELGVGSVTKDNNKGQFFIRDRKQIENIILPIFNKYTLLTSKYFDYVRFKKALYILNETNINKEERYKELMKLKNSKKDENYLSPAWNNVSLPLTDINVLQNIMTKSWVVGFIEAEGSFYLVSKDSKRIVLPSAWLIGFGEVAINFLCSPILNSSSKFETEFQIIINQDELILLHIIKRFFRIKNAIKYNKEDIILNTKNSRAIEKILKFFSGKFKGMKSLEFKLWCKAKFFIGNNKVDKVKKISEISKALASRTCLSRLQKNNVISNKRYFSLIANSTLRNYRSTLLSLNSKDRTGLFNSSISSNANPVVTYSNADTFKLQIVKENRRKSGIYCWTNLNNGKSYEGSSGNLGERFYRYYKIDFLMAALKRSRSKIYSSILKNGYSKFKVDILEYCNKEDLIKREQYYLDLLKPEYNILSSASSSRGFKTHRRS